MTSPEGRATRWEQDQKTGFFGFKPRARGESGVLAAAQPLHWHRVDIAKAHEEVGDIFLLWAQSRHAPNAPALSGGSLDAWPQVLLQGFGVCAQEETAVMAWLRSEEAGNG